MTITTGTGWEAIGTRRELCGERIFTIDAPSIGPERHAPLLVLHGFPTSSFDYAAVLDGLRAGRRVLLFDMLGYGLSAKPDRAYTIALQADIATAYLAALGVDRLALLTHDMGDTVGGELLARRAEGAWKVEVTRRVVTNGSIYIDQAHLTGGVLQAIPALSLDRPPRRGRHHRPGDAVGEADAGGAVRPRPPRQRRPPGPAGCRPYRLPPSLRCLSGRPRVERPA